MERMVSSWDSDAGSYPVADGSGPGDGMASDEEDISGEDDTIAGNMY